MLWDKIILRGEKAVINYKEMNGKYPFFDDGTGLRLRALVYNYCVNHVASM